MSSQTSNDTALFGEIIRHYREKAGITMTQLSARLGEGFTIAYISQLERGLMSPPRERTLEREEKLKRLANTLVDAVAEKTELAIKRREQQ
jgi:transcriptional regulator with XRE-family HTH domain